MKKEERKERAKQEKEELEKQQRALEQEIVLSEKEQLRIRLEKMEEGEVEVEAVDRLERKCDSTGPCEPAAEEERSEQEV